MSDSENIGSMAEGVVQQQRADALPGHRAASERLEEAAAAAAGADAALEGAEAAAGQSAALLEGARELAGAAPGAALGAAKSRLKGMLGGALSGLAGAVAAAASAAGLDGVAQAVEDAAASRAVGFDDGLQDLAGDLPADGVKRTASQRFRAGVVRSLSMSRRMRFGDADDPDVNPTLHFTLTERQQQLRAEAARFAEECLPLAPQGAAAGAPPGERLRHALEGAARCGFTRMVASRSSGGLGLPMDSSVAVAEALGAADLGFAGLMAAHNAAVHVLATHGTTQLHAKLLRHATAAPGGAAGGGPFGLAALALAEAATGSDAVGCATYAERDASGQFYHLSGGKAWVAGAASAELLLVLARTAVEARKGLSLFVLARSMPGLEVGKTVPCLGWAGTPVAPVSFGRMVVRMEHLLGREGQGLELVQEALDLQRLWLASASIGCAAAALQRALHGSGGKLSGAAAALGKAALGALPGDGDGGGGGGSSSNGGLCIEGQANQAKGVAAHTRLHAARLMVRSAAQQLDCRAPNAACEVCVAKMFSQQAAEAAARAAQELAAPRAGGLAGLFVGSGGGGSGTSAVEVSERALMDLRACAPVGGCRDALAGRVFGDLFKLSAAT